MPRRRGDLVPRQFDIDAILRELAEEEPRDETGLTQKQRAFLRARHLTFHDREALDLAGCTRADLERWQAEEPFNTIYTRLVPRDGYAVARAGIGSLLPRAIQVLDDALDNEDAKRREWAVKQVLALSGLQRLTVEHDHVKIPYEAVLAVRMLEKGQVPPPQMMELAERFFPESKALLKSIEEATVEGEARVLEEEA